MFVITNCFLNTSATFQNNVQQLLLSHPLRHPVNTLNKKKRLYSFFFYNSFTTLWFTNLKSRTFESHKGKRLVAHFQVTRVNRVKMKNASLWNTRASDHALYILDTEWYTCCLKINESDSEYTMILLLCTYIYPLNEHFQQMDSYLKQKKMKFIN